MRKAPKSVGMAEVDGEILHGLPSFDPRPMKFKVKLDSGREIVGFTKRRRWFRRKLSPGDRVIVRVGVGELVSSRGFIVRRYP